MIVTDPSCDPHAGPSGEPSDPQTNPGTDASLLTSLVRECASEGFSPTLESWDERIRPVLEGFVRDASDPGRAREARAILEAWEDAIGVINRLWEQSRASADEASGRES